MLYLSLLHLPRSDRAWRQLDAYQAHQLAWKAFPEKADAERPFLFSLDKRSKYQSLLVQSTSQPDWSFINGDVNIQTTTFTPAEVPAGTRLRYFLRANPTVQRRGFADGKSRRVSVGVNREHTAQQMGISPEELPPREDQLLEWLRRRGETGGFEVENCLPGPTIERRIVRPHRNRAGEPPMILHEVELTGILNVHDNKSFAQACAEGIGRGKAFGFGLLMLRPLQAS